MVVAASLSGLLLFGTLWWSVHLATDAHHTDVPHCDARGSLHLHDASYAAADCVLSAFIWSPFIDGQAVVSGVLPAEFTTTSVFGESQHRGFVLPLSLACRAPPAA